MTNQTVTDFINANREAVSQMTKGELIKGYMTAESTIDDPEKALAFQSLCATCYASAKADFSNLTDEDVQNYYWVHAWDCEVFTLDLALEFIQHDCLAKFFTSDALAMHVALNGREEGIFIDSVTNIKRLATLTLCRMIYVFKCSKKLMRAVAYEMRRRGANGDMLAQGCFDNAVANGFVA